MKGKIAIIKESEKTIGFVTICIDDYGQVKGYGCIDEDIEVIETDREHLQNALDNIPLEFLQTINGNTNYKRKNLLNE